MSQDTEKSASPHPLRGEESFALSRGEPPAVPLGFSMRGAYLLIVALSLAIGITSIVRGTSGLTSNAASDLTNFFLKSAAYIARGDPWRLYAIRADPPFQSYPNDGTPLNLFLMALPLRLAYALGGARNAGLQVTVVALPFTLLAPLLGYVVVEALRLLRPAIPPAQRLLAFGLVTLSPLLWLCYTPWGHLEQPLQLYLLAAAVIALQRRYEALAGVLAGLAVLTGVTTLLPLAALCTLLVVDKEWRALLVAGGLAAGVTLLGLAPFVLGDRPNTVYSLITWRGKVGIGSNSMWSVFTVVALPHALGALVRRLDTPLMLVLAIGVAVLAARRRRVSAYSPDAWAVLAIAALGLPLLSKFNWPYYYLQPFVLLLIWEFGTVRDDRSGLWRRPLLTLGYLVIASSLATYIGLKSVGALDRVGVGLLEFGVMLLFTVAVWRRLCL